MDWSLFDGDHHHERVKTCFIKKTLKLCEEFAYVLILFSRVLKTGMFKIGISVSSLSQNLKFKLIP